MKRKGISLITLVITIAIIIILAGAVILNLSDNNPVEGAKKTGVMQDIDTFRTELTLKLTTGYTNGIFDTESINAVTKEDILKYIPSMKDVKIGKALYTDILVVSEGQLAIDGIKANEWVTNGKLKQKEYDWIVEALGNNVFNAQTYSIKYYINDGTEQFTESSKIHNVKYIILSNSKDRVGYGFKCWNTAQDGTGVMYNAGDEYALNEELTLYAQWEAGTYGVTYYKNDGTNEAKTAVKTKDVAYEIEDKGFTKAGYTFGGWNTKEDGSGTDYDVGTNYTENKAIELYAKWYYAGPKYSASDIKLDASKYYGAYVNYTPSNGCSVKWRVFLADTRIYLIAEDYVPNSYLSDANFSISGNYAAFSDISRQDLMTKLTTSSYYVNFKDNVGKAENVVGAPTLEQFVTSYNEVNDTDINILNVSAGQSVKGLFTDNTANADGYVLSLGTSENYGYAITIPEDANKYDLYIRANKTNSGAMWIATFSAAHEKSIMHSWCGSSVGGNPYGNYHNAAYGVRPLVILNSSVKLIDPDGDGVYDLE